MKIRLMLGLVFVLGLGTSVYYTEKAPVHPGQTGKICCGGDPGAPAPIPIPIPVPSPTPGN
jgi:hypothetical protein